MHLRETEVQKRPIRENIQNVRRDSSVSVNIWRLELYFLHFIYRNMNLHKDSRSSDWKFSKRIAVEGEEKNITRENSEQIVTG